MFLFVLFILTFPFIRNVTVAFLALEVTVIVLRNVLGIFVLKFIFILPVLPGKMGSFDHLATVHPHDGRTLLMTIDVFILLVNMNSQCPGLPTSMIP